MSDDRQQGTTAPGPAPLAPRPNRILAEPATVQACASDYQAAVDVRQTLAAQEARAQR